MTREEAIIILKDCELNPCVPKDKEAADMAIKALEHPERNVVAIVPCGDAISRRAVLDLIADYDLSMGQVVKGIHALPSVNPQKPVLDKIRAEIIQIPTISFNANDVYKADVLQIIDKYGEESEGKG